MQFHPVTELDPFAGFLSLQRELDRVFRNTLAAGCGVSRSGAFPAVNVSGSRDGIVVRAEVPGVDPQTIDVAIDGRTLTISGERSAPSYANGNSQRRERHTGKFSRSLDLPEDLDTGQVTADCRNGILTIRVPKRAEAKPRQIKVTAH